MSCAWRVLSFVLAVLAIATPARADDVQVTAKASASTVEIGDLVSYTLQIMAPNGAPAARDPEPGNVAGFTVRGTATGPVHLVTIGPGGQRVLSGTTTTWSLRADTAGSFTLGPASVAIGGQRRTAAPVRVTVVPRGQAPRRFDPFQGLFDLGEEPPAPPPVPSDPRLALGVPRAAVAFLHATVDKTRAVVGEQITLSVYLYEDPHVHQGQPRDVHEPAAADFVKRPLVEDESRALSLGMATVGDRQWSVKLVRRSALFPLKAGRLVIEAMSLTLPHARGGLRRSERLAVEVAEPPLAGRPPGYTVGDVGDMSLSATVSPRSIDQDGAVSVLIELRGTGNLPAQLSMPVAPGIEWLEAQVREKLGAQGSERFGGTRTLSYVARLHKDGAIDLGEVRLPFYDPDKRAYGVASASLGIVDVKKGAAKDGGADPDEQILTGMPKERRVLEGARAASFLSDEPAYWGLLFGSPALCAAIIGAGRLGRRVQERREATSRSPARLAKERRAAADSACRGEDGKAAMGAIARAVEAEVLARTGVNARGADTETIARELAEAGFAKVDGVVAILRACEDARFSPDGVSIASAREAWGRAREAVEALGREQA